ncbi:MAG: hypothetical protein SFV17_05270 [Candidatus Obscuribacter sp.]|nr:hypothetical protein [Candidatus Melainabacteria bacterium]MDX1986077.1 hypothetical protein [Candidatus Obscuribacter sp.]
MAKHQSLSSKARRNGAIIFALGLTTFITVAATKPKPGQEDLRAVSGGAGLLCMVLGGGILTGILEPRDLTEEELAKLPPLERNRVHLERCYKLKRKKEREKREEG